MKQLSLHIIILISCLSSCNQPTTKVVVQSQVGNSVTSTAIWVAPDTSTLGNSDTDRLIKYGRELISNTSLYLGPHGKVMNITNGMNCQNCHLDAGTKPFGNNYAAVAATYPKYRGRSGSIESIYKRVNDCVQRSLNGTALDTSSQEMQAVKAYIEWLGKDVPKGTSPKGTGLLDLAYLDQPADPEKGKIVYASRCETCHWPNGEGKFNANNGSYQYPPLWGAHSYNIGAGLYRISRFAGYVKSNMPFGTSYEHPQLTDEEAWNVAAYVNSQPRPGININKDWPKIEAKPDDYPFGPYADTFSERQHKYGPFLPIAEYKKQNKHL